MLRPIALAVVLCLPWIVWQSGMDYAANYAEELASPAFWLRSAEIFARRLLAHTSGLAWLVAGAGIALVAMLRAWRSAELPPDAPPEPSSEPWRDRGAVAIVGVAFAMFATLCIVAPDAFFRYLAPILPLVALGVGGLVGYGRRVVGPLFASAVLAWVVALQPLPQFLHELRSEFAGPIEGIVTFLRERAEPEDVVWITYGDMPLKYYLNLRIVGGLTGEDLDAALAESPPDWVIVRHNVVSEPRDGAVRAFIEREIDLASFRKIELPFTDTPFENREEPSEHRYRAAQGGPPVVIHERRRAGS